MLCEVFFTFASISVSKFESKNLENEITLYLGYTYDPYYYFYRTLMILSR